MDNKLQELTRKLYEEGLEKGRAEAGSRDEDAQTQAAKILADAKAEADRIVAAASQKADENARNTATEVALASRQSIAALKKMIGSMVSASTIEGPVAKLALDADFIKDMILTVAKGWNGAAGGPADLEALLPANEKEKFEAALKGSLS
ncbi:MAG: hypothetical protein LBU95_06270, partial [Rikenellaceae bacterium]|nr:hypothetical protein [Rikenellaceae bacterium]